MVNRSVKTRSVIVCLNEVDETLDLISVIIRYQVGIHTTREEFVPEHPQQRRTMPRQAVVTERFDQFFVIRSPACRDVKQASEPFRFRIPALRHSLPPCIEERVPLELSAYAVRSIPFRSRISRTSAVS